MDTFRKEAQETLEIVKDYCNEEWQFVAEKHGIESTKKHFSGKPAAFKLKTILKGISYKAWLDTFYFERRKWDTSINPSSKVVDDLKDAEDMRITLDVTNSAAGGLISERDFICLAWWGCKDGVGFEVGATTKYNVPSTKGAVRGQVYPSGCILKPLEAANGEIDPEEKRDWEFYYIVHAALNGMLPKSLIESTMSGQLLGYIQTYRDYLGTIGYPQ